MCGRYNVTPNAEAFIEAFDIIEGIELLPDTPRYNIAPSGAPVPAVRQGERGRALCLLQWPLIPHWAKEGSIKFSTANAKGETVADKPSFRTAWRKGRRCLIPANGYYEWRKTADRKQPYHIQLPGGELFAFGGLWDRCQTNAGDTIESCTIITTPPTAVMREIHPRMPLIIPRSAYAQWLSGDDAAEHIRPFDDLELECHPVSTFVNNPRNDDPRCLEPA
ncbi:MAG: SOS response-associated peptidase [Gammaproteobacteria bacterium]|nr:SOS response-associated peptidase [Gammaproteobacteria bacterium]